MIRTGFTRSVEDNFEALVLLDEASGDSIEFQRSLINDAQDVLSGQDTYAIVRGGGPVHYGGLVGFAMRSGVLELKFAPDAAAVLKLPAVLELVLDDAGLRTVEQHLPRIVAPSG